MLRSDAHAVRSSPQSERSRCASWSLQHWAGGLIIAVVGLSAAVAEPADDPRLPAVGDVVPPYPGGTTSLSGTCLADLHDTVCRFMVADLASVAPNAKPFAIFAGQRVGHGISARWLVTDVMTVPDITAGYHLDAVQCTGTSGQLHPVAIVRSDPDQFTLTDVIWAAAFDPVTARFSQIDTDGISCDNPAP